MYKSNLTIYENDSNWIGLWTLYKREILRFFKVYTQTLLAPMVTSLLFLSVFTLAFGSATRVVSGLFHTSSSLMVAKAQGSIVDTLMPPFTAQELTFGIALGGMTRGIIVGFVVGVAMALVVGSSIYHIGYIIFYAFMASLMLSLLGIIGGIWSEKFDHIAAITNFIITPLSFLSGTFYSIERLPEIVQIIAKFNPFFYMIDGFRYGFIDRSDSALWIGILVMAGINMILVGFAAWMFSSGYKLKA
jgi:ABC-2 type transport system permease protein